MKRIWIAVFLLLTVAVLCTSGSMVLKSRTNKLIGVLEEGISACEGSRKNQLKESAEKINKEWERSHIVLSMMIRHSDLEDLEKCIKELPYLAKAGDKDGFKSNCRDGIIVINHILDSEKLNLGNIF